jgi:hypothetical protein
MSAGSPRLAVAVPLAVLVFVVTAVYRFNLLGGQLGGLENDEYLVISRAAAMLHGELPTRDFVDFGAPLSYVATAAAMRATGGTLLGHAVLSALMLAVGSALTYWVALRASGSSFIALLMALVQIALGPRFYSYPKIVLYALGVLGWWAYARRPWWPTLAALGVLTAVAFLFRHDHAVYIALGTLVLLLVLVRETGIVRSTRALIVYGAVVTICLTPYLAFLKVNGGVLEHLRLGMQISRVDRGRTQLRWPVFTLDPGRRLIEVEDAAPQPRPRITVRWQQPLPPGAADTFARTYKLRPRGSSSREGREFEVTDESPDLLQRLAADPLVADTQNIDRSEWRIRERPAPDAWLELVRSMPALRTRVLPGVLRPENAVPFVYYVFLALPYIAAALCVSRVVRRGDAAAWHDAYRMVPIIATMMLLNGWFLRGTLPVRLADVSVLAAALGAWLLSASLSSARRSGWPVRAGVTAAVGALLVAIVGSAMSIGVLVPNLRTATDGRGLAGIEGRTREVARFLDTPGPELAAQGAATSPSMRLADYVHRCTKPSDRVLVAAYMPQVFYFADRGFAGGHVDVRAGYLADERDQRAAIAHMRRQAVPLVVTEAREVFETRYRKESPILVAYLDDAYVDAGDHDFGGESYRVLVHEADAPHAARRDGLPCFP